MSGSRFLAAVRLLVYFLFTCAAIPVQVAALAARSRLAERVPMLYHSVCCRIMGLGISVSGRVPERRPMLLISNHSSYLDIIVLAALMPVCFVAKSEVASWPFFGLLAKLQRTVFVDRRSRNVGDHQEQIRQRLESGDNLILFPEGTSSDGNRTLPFKSALFAAAGLRIDNRPVSVQPVSITCTALDELPIGRRYRPFYAWYGDMDLLPHLWSMAGMGRMTVQVTFHPPTTLPECGTRKALAQYCWHLVSKAVDDANAGRLVPPAVFAGSVAADTVAAADLNP